MGWVNVCELVLLSRALFAPFKRPPPQTPKLDTLSPKTPKPLNALNPDANKPETQKTHFDPRLQ